MSTDSLSPSEFAAEVDRLGADGLTQQQIAEQLGLTKNQVRWRLLNSGYTWGSETRVRVSATGERISEEVAA